MNGSMEAVPLGEVVKPTRPRVKPFDHPDLPFVGMEQIEAHSMKLLGTVPAKTMKSSAVHFKAGDVLYGRLRPYLNKVYRPNFEGLCSAEFIVLPENDRVDGAYLQYFLNSGAFVRYAMHLNAGDRPRVDFDQLAAYKIPLPGLDDQRRIVAEIEKQFSRVDDAVASLKHVKINLKHYKAAVLRAAVEGRLVPTEAELARRENRSYETAAQLLQRILDARRDQWMGKTKYQEPLAPDTAELPKLPEGWVYATAEQLTDQNRAITYGVIKLGDSVDGGVPVLRSSDVRNLRIDLGNVKSISQNIAANYRRTVLQGGEVVVTVRGTLGGIAVVPPLCSGFNISREVAMLALVEPAMAHTVTAFIASAPIERWLMSRTKGIAYTGINIETLKALPLPVPPPGEQHRIVAEIDYRLSLVREVEAGIDGNLKRAHALRSATLAGCFSCQGKE